MKEGEGSGQHGEDRILSLVFRKQAMGLLVDVGAADGFYNSNSIGLLKRPRWEGILIEPELEQFLLLEDRYKDNPQVTCVRCAIGVEEGKKTLFSSGQVSTFKQKVKEAAEAVHKVSYTTQEVEMLTLTRLLIKLSAFRDIDFLSIDVEGMNYEVWLSLDKSMFSPKLVCIEGKGYAMHGYRELCRLGANTFYLREDACTAL